MFLPDFLVRSRRVVTPLGPRPAAVHIRSGKIIGIVDVGDVPAGCPMDDAGGAGLLPGLVDTQVHVSDGFERATQAAAAGGITTIIAMPGHSGAAEGACSVDVGFWARVSVDNVREIAELAQTRGFGFVGGHVPPTHPRGIMPGVPPVESTF